METAIRVRTSVVILNVVNFGQALSKRSLPRGQGMVNVLESTRGNCAALLGGMRYMNEGRDVLKRFSTLIVDTNPDLCSWLCYNSPSHGTG